MKHDFKDAHNWFRETFKDMADMNSDNEEVYKAILFALALADKVTGEPSEGMIDAAAYYATTEAKFKAMIQKAM